MSRAFVRENDGADVPEDFPERPVSAHPNLVTPSGLKQIAEHVRELEVARDEARNNDDKVALTSIERDLRYWQQRRATAKVVEAQPDAEKVRFGARVTLRYDDGHERSYTLVGEDEADPARGLVSWISPIAQSLIGAEVGNQIRLQDRSVEVLRVEAPSAARP